ncbi:alanine racemase [candidate division KSB1 bacterium]
MNYMNRRNFVRLAGAVPAAGLLSCYGPGSQEGSPIRTVSSSYDPWLEIDLNNIKWNIDLIRNRVNGRPIMAVIKANAYGHGLAEVGKYLEKISIDAIAVGKLSEGIELRNAGVKCPILNLGPFSDKDAEHIVRNDISQSVYSDNVLALDSIAGKINKQAKVHINIDTGMGRVGAPFYNAFSFVTDVSNLANVKIEGVFTALTEETEFDVVQLQRLTALCEELKNRGIDPGLRHAASSAGILGFDGSYLDMVRPGICIYGHFPSDKEYDLKKIDLKPALSLKTRVSYVKTLRPGDAISYHQKFVAEKEEKVITASLGYSDGFPYNVLGKTEALVNGKKFPVFADITANHFYVNVTGEENVSAGDEIVLIGSQGDEYVGAQELAIAADTSVYKITIWMNPLLPRIYKS